jgi:Subtilase family
MANSVFGARTGFGGPCCGREVAEASDVLEAQPASRGQRDRQSALDVILGTRAAATPVAVPVAVIDGPYDAAALSGVLARAPVSLGNGGSGVNPKSACNHGTFVMGLLGARRDAWIPGICPECQLLHVSLFMNEDAPQASVVELANAIMVAVKAGARLINLSIAILGDDAQDHRELAAALDRAEASPAGSRNSSCRVPLPRRPRPAPHPAGPAPPKGHPGQALAELAHCAGRGAPRLRASLHHPGRDGQTTPAPRSRSQPPSPRSSPTSWLSPRPAHSKALGARTPRRRGAISKGRNCNPAAACLPRPPRPPGPSRDAIKVAPWPDGPDCQQPPRRRRRRNDND